MLSLLASKKYLLLDYLGCLEKIVLGERISKMRISPKDEYYGVKVDWIWPKSWYKDQSWWFSAYYFCVRKKIFQNRFIYNAWRKWFWWANFENAYFVQRWPIWTKSWLNMTQKLIYGLKISRQVGFYENVSVNLFTKNIYCQDTCFLKHIKKISLIWRFSFAKKTKIWDKIPSSDLSLVIQQVLQ